ncbi:hypothetical protein [Actinacidiphila bryophytorum]|uniref:Uncharacterized protein n=1 Tax=Actinacidiphila bryophytorum TaxID=1436133 RepID=A0A9W4H1T0_9ACTN|nr:hypothetical protein [Actinacidiphila bryophytorum]MBM9435169.1 hypothetical protein [Actinacidiphila bryophytorum]MBN6541550.1 hypothetical protein [Actinacidiphila bryophytorum]CAG7643542.1 conserved hypothetical protein [Actinacidiphila bryophytorum]
MGKKNEDEIKRALGIPSWRNLSKDKVIKFAAMMPDMATEVRMKIVEQFPNFKDLAKNSVDAVRAAHESTLSANEKSEDNFHRASQQQRDVLEKDLNRDDLSWEERKFFHETFRENVSQESQKDSENKHFLEREHRVVAAVAGAAMVLGAVFVGARVMGEGKDDSDGPAEV